MMYVDAAKVGSTRQRQVAVRDRSTEGRRGGSFDVDVDPLVVAGDVGEPVDRLLGDLHPFCRAERLVDGRFEFRHRREDAVPIGVWHQTTRSKIAARP